MRESIPRGVEGWDRKASGSGERRSNAQSLLSSLLPVTPSSQSSPRVNAERTASKFGAGSNRSQKESMSQSFMLSRRHTEVNERISNGPNIYQIGTEIGRGGFAVVFQAFNVETGDFVAVKRFPLAAIDDESLNSIEAEVELMQKLNHPNIVKYIDTIRTKAFLHIVLEYMENGSLANVLKRFGSFSESLIAIYITQVLRGLKYLHEQGVLHRDIKGANILTTKDGTVKLADFGVSMKLSEAGAAHQEDQAVVGTPYWVAPEIIEMSAPTSACDIWSVGCTIVELLTGKPPYFDLAPMAALFRIVQDDFPPLPDSMSQALRDFLLQCFQKEPVMRSSATQLLDHQWLRQTGSVAATKLGGSGDTAASTLSRSLGDDDKNYSASASLLPASLTYSSSSPGKMAVPVRRSAGSSADSSSAGIFNKDDPHQQQHHKQQHSSKPSEMGQSLSSSSSSFLRAAGSKHYHISKGAAATAATAVDNITVAGTKSKISSFSSLAALGLSTVVPPSSSVAVVVAEAASDDADVTVAASLSSTASVSPTITNGIVAVPPSDRTTSEHTLPSSPIVEQPIVETTSLTVTTTTTPAPSHSHHGSHKNNKDSEHRQSLSVSPEAADHKEHEERKEDEKEDWDSDDEEAATPRRVVSISTSSSFVSSLPNITDLLLRTTPSSSPRSPPLLLQSMPHTSSSFSGASGTGNVKAPSADRIVTDNKGKGESVEDENGDSVDEGEYEDKFDESEEEEEEDWDAEFQGDMPVLSALKSSRLSISRGGSISLRSHSLSPPLPPPSTLSEIGVKVDFAPSTPQRQRQRIPQEYVEDIKNFLCEPTSPIDVKGTDHPQTAASRSAASEKHIAASSASASAAADGDQRLAHRRRQMSSAAAAAATQGKPYHSLPMPPPARGLSNFPLRSNTIAYSDDSSTAAATAAAGSHVAAAGSGSVSDMLMKYKEDPNENIIDGNLASELEQIDDRMDISNGPGSAGGGSANSIGVRGPIGMRLLPSLSMNSEASTSTEGSLTVTATTGSSPKLSARKIVIPSRDLIFGSKRPPSVGASSSVSGSVSGGYGSGRVVSKSLASELRQRMKLAVKQTYSEANFDDLLKLQYDEEDLQQQSTNRELDMKKAREIIDLMGQIKPDVGEKDVMVLCGKMLELLTAYPHVKDMMINHYGVTPIMDMFESQAQPVRSPTAAAAPRSSIAVDWGSTSSSSSSSGAFADRSVARQCILQVINRIVEGCQRAQEQLSLMGLLPAIIRILENGSKAVGGGGRHSPTANDRSSSSSSSSMFAVLFSTSKGAAAASNVYSIDPAVLEAAKFIHLISSTSSLTLQMLIGAGGLSALIHMLSYSNLLSIKVDGSQSPWSPLLPACATGLISSNSSSSSKAGVPALANTLHTQPSSLGTDLTNTDDFAAESSGTMTGGPPSPGGSVATATSSHFARPTAGGGIPDTVVVSEDAKSMVYMGIDCVMQVFAVQSSRTRDFCRLFIKLGLLRHLSQAFTHIMTMFPTTATLPATSLDLGHSYSVSSNKSEVSVGSDYSGGGGGSLRHHRKTSDITEFSYVSSSDEILALVSDPDCSVECRYAYCIASIFLKFSRSDSIVSEQMAHEPGVLQGIISALQSPELRNNPTASTSIPTSVGAGSGNISVGGSGSGIAPTFGAPLNDRSPVLSRSASGFKSFFDRRRITLSGLSYPYVTIIEMLLKCVKNLSMEPAALSDLDEAGTISTLIPLLSGPISERCKNHVMPCIFNLCRINKRRQEQAAVCGIIPHLQSLITNESHLKQFALPIICDLAHTSSTTRIELWKNGGVAFYINLLRENYWQTFALNSLATWLANDTDYVQSLLIQPTHLSRLVDFFRAASLQTIRTLHKPLLDMMSKSTDLTRALCSSGLYVTALIRRLKNSEALVLRSLLKMLHLLHQHHPSPRQFVLDYNLYSVVRSLAQAEAQVLVHQMANRLLLDFQHSTMS